MQVYGRLCLLYCYVSNFVCADYPHPDLGFQIREGSKGNNRIVGAYQRGIDSLEEFRKKLTHGVACLHLDDLVELGSESTLCVEYNICLEPSSIRNRDVREYNYSLDCSIHCERGPTETTTKSKFDEPTEANRAGTQENARRTISIHGNELLPSEPRETASDTGRQSSQGRSSKLPKNRVPKASAVFERRHNKCPQYEESIVELVVLTLQNRVTSDKNALSDAMRIQISGLNLPKYLALPAGAAIAARDVVYNVAGDLSSRGQSAFARKPSRQCKKGTAGCKTPVYDPITSLSFEGRAVHDHILSLLGQDVDEYEY